MNTNDEEIAINHLIRCYANVQQVIRFMDTKAAVVFTLSGVMLGGLAANPSDWDDWANPLLYVAVAFTVLAMVLALRAVWPTHGPKEGHQLTLLFPALLPGFAGRRRKGIDIPTLVDARLPQINAAYVTGEYGTQLAHLHKAIVRKICALRGSIFAIGIAIVALGVCQFGRKPEEKSKEPLKVQAECVIHERGPNGVRTGSGPNGVSPVFQAFGYACGHTAKRPFLL